MKNRFTQNAVAELRVQDKKHAEEYKDLVNSEGENIVDNFKGFFGYFDSLINNRKNFYKIDGKTSRIATRALNENLIFFAENLYIFQTHFNGELLREMTKDEKKVFQQNFYNNCLLQNDITNYNLVIGDINKKINKYNQSKDKKIPFLKILYKQILSLENKEDYKHIEIRNDEDLIVAIKDFTEVNANKITVGEKIFNTFIARCRSKNNLDKIYFPKDSMNTIARKIFKPWEDIMALYKSKYFVSLQELNKLMESQEWQKMAEESREKNKHLIFKDFVARDIPLGGRDNFVNFLLILEKEYQNQFTGFEREARGKRIKFIGYNEGLKNLQIRLKLFEDKKSKNIKLNDDEKTEWIKTIKEYADAALRVFQMTKYLWLPIIGDENDKDYRKIKAEIEGLTQKDQNFYNNIDSYIIGYEPYVYRSSFQEYLTRKPFSEDKFKINFGSGRLLKGWDKDKIHERLGIILKKSNKYFLGIIKRNDNHCLDNLELFSSSNQEGYDLMQFKQLTGLYRQIPRMAFPEKKKPILEASHEVKKIKEEFDAFQNAKQERRISNKEKFDNIKLNILINHYRRFIKENYKNEKFYDFSLLKDSKKYENLKDFYADVDKITYDLSFKKVNIDSLVSEGKIFLFTIWSKDFSQKSKGKYKNLQTDYFKALFKQDDSNSGRVRLGAEAQIFFRPKTQADQLNKKQDKNGKEVIDHKRYAEDKIFLHLPIQLNADVYIPEDVNINILKLLNERDPFAVKVIGIDRGEKNLAYYSVVSQTPDGKVKVEACGDLNLGYLEPLDKLEKDRQEQRKAWQSISAIKSKRDGYISHAIRKIADLILYHNAIVVFEDLSGGFKRARMKVEKAPYQQLELALIKKLNYLVGKNIQEGKPGHYLSAHQLTEQVGSYKDMGKQTGIIFYTQAGYTSRTCPQCGWRKRIQGLRYKNLDTTRELFDFKKGIQISFDGKCFVFSYLIMYEGKTTKERGRKIYSDVSRIRWDNKKRNYIFYEANEITKELHNLLRKYDIILKDNINSQIQNIKERDFWEHLTNLLLLILEIRNTDNESGRDYIECPHCHFHSEKGFHGHKWNGDANGAFNIARKGLIIVERIQASNEPEKMTWGDLSVGIKDWDSANARWAKENGIE